MGRWTDVRNGNPDGAVAATNAGGIAAGARVMTLDGEIPVEFLNPGDRIVTREGMRRVVEVRMRRYSGPAMHLAEGALGHDRPQTGLTLPPGTLLHLRDWRARALYGEDRANAPLSALFDGEFVTEVQVRDLRIFDLSFETPQVIYVEGLELACTAAPLAPVPIRPRSARSSAHA